MLIAYTHLHYIWSLHILPYVFPQGRKPEWEQLCEQVRALQAGGGGDGGGPSEAPQHWETRAKDAEYRLVQICSLLIGAPDPLPFFNSVAGLSARIVGKELE